MIIKNIILIYFIIGFIIFTYLTFLDRKIIIKHIKRYGFDWVEIIMYFLSILVFIIIYPILFICLFYKKKRS